MKKITFSIIVCLLLFGFTSIEEKSQKANNTSIRPFIEFIPYTDSISEKGFIGLDTLVAHIIQYDMINASQLLMTPINSEDEYLKDNFIGILRYRKVISYLRSKIGNDGGGFFLYRDVEYTYKGKNHGGFQNSGIAYSFRKR